MDPKGLAAFLNAGVELKLCPGCGVPCEKNDGCDAMNCWRCPERFSWSSQPLLTLDSAPQQADESQYGYSATSPNYSPTSPRLIPRHPGHPAISLHDDDGHPYEQYDYTPTAHSYTPTDPSYTLTAPSYTLTTPSYTLTSPPLNPRHLATTVRPYLPHDQSGILDDGADEDEIYD